MNFDSLLYRQLSLLTFHRLEIALARMATVVTNKHAEQQGTKGPDL